MSSHAAQPLIPLTVRTFFTALPVLAATLLACPAQGQQPAATPPPAAPSTLWLGKADYPLFVVEGTDAKNGNLTIERATLGAPGGPVEGFRFTTLQHGQTPLTVQARANAPQAADAGDVMLAHFFLRTVKSEQESGEGKVGFVFERPGPSFEKSGAYEAKAANGWKEFYIPFAVKGAFKPGEVRVIFRLGYQRQTVEVAGFEIKNYHRAVAVGALPMTRVDLSYLGMEPTAAWRAEAEARIEKIRKSALTVQVVDAAGRPVPGARVEIRQTTHEFGFGSAVKAEAIVAPPGPDGRNAYTDAILHNFNVVTIDNALKWPRWEKDRELPLQAARWLKEHDVALRGHNLVWPGWRHLPASVKALQNQPEELHKFVIGHVEDEAAALARYVSVWDVINETQDNHDLMDILGEKILTEIFQTTARLSPGVGLFINDYGIVTGDGLDLGHQASYHKVIQFLQEQKAPLQGIGIQGHFGEQFTAPTRVLNILDQYAKYGLPIQMTEFTLMSDDLEANAHFLRDMLTVFFSHPSVNAFMLWGFYDGPDFKHKATLFDESGKPTPAGKVWREMIYEKWWTRENAAAGADGTASVRGYHGRYEVSVTGAGGNGAPVKATAELKPGGTTVKVVLK